MGRVEVYGIAGVLLVLVLCAVLATVSGCGRFFADESSGTSANPAAPQQPAAPQVAPQPAPPPPREPAPRPPRAPSPKRVEKAVAAPESGFAGPLNGKSWARTRIFGDYKPGASLFAGQRLNRYGRPYYHQGVDVLAPEGTRLIAPADGDVVISGMWDPNGYGRVVLIRVRAGGNYVYALYAHLSKVLVYKGARVRRGQLVALSGKSGNAAGMPRAEEHVHVEVWTKEKVGSRLSGRLDPLRHFPDVVIAPSP